MFRASGSLPDRREHDVTASAKKMNARIGGTGTLGSCSYPGNIAERGTVMCEVCKKVRDSNESLIWYKDKNGEPKGYVEIRYKHDRFELWSGNCFREINYCPICGRKLKDGEEKHLNENEEKFTKCDKCEQLEECKENRKVLNIKSGCEEFPHYVPNIGAICEKEVETNREIREQKKLLDKISKLEDRHQSDCIKINQLHTTIDVLVEKLERLLEVHGL